MKEFWIYTALRLGLFLGAFAIVFGIWFVAADSVPVIWVIVVAFLLSGVASFLLLNDQRNAFAKKVEARAGKVNDRYEAARAKEDLD
ncbi:DUF4229 domain-containing protein [Nocardioides sp. GY 10113]|uniref:DUF4229 domain-containing protein n=1 Tax=Nocardioides sp. GY 10113 TaxID=2569761 RepID=UPI0010A85ABA|nr:DUF4229 domain-containing protein [Nocardioides sp. GY 10113]TIC89263.1 DUF4229 domain-containing protein [Nocardioides sp. GY 10113]